MQKPSGKISCYLRNAPSLYSHMTLHLVPYKFPTFCYTVTGIKYQDSRWFAVLSFYLGFLGTGVLANPCPHVGTVFFHCKLIDRPQTLRKIEAQRFRYEKVEGSTFLKGTASFRKDPFLLKVLLKKFPIRK